MAEASLIAHGVALLKMVSSVTLLASTSNRA